MDSGPDHCGAPPNAAPSSAPSVYRVIQPDAKKRERILLQAKREEEAYERKKEASRLKHVYEPPQRLGGGTSDIYEARLRQQRETLRCGPHQAALRRRELMERQRKDEEMELTRKKEEARKKAEENEEREMRRRERAENVDVEEVRNRRLRFLMTQ